MVYNNTTSKENENELAIQIFSEAADEIASCSNDLLMVAEAITQSCHMIGTSGDDYGEVLSSRAQNFMMLAGLYKTKSSRFEGIVKRLEGERQEDNVLVENVLF